MMSDVCLFCAKSQDVTNLVLLDLTAAISFYGLRVILGFDEQSGLCYLHEISETWMHARSFI